MSLRQSAGGDTLSRTTQLPQNKDANFTVMYWLKIVNDNGKAVQGSWCRGNTAQAVADLVYFNISGTRNFTISTNAFDAFGATNLALGKWYHIALTKNKVGDLGIGYINGVEDVRDSAANHWSQAINTDKFLFVYDTSVNFWCDARYAAYKFWQNRVMSPAEIKNEMWFWYPQSIEGLFNYSTFSRELYPSYGVSGDQNLPWTKNGSPLMEEDPPNLSWYQPNRFKRLLPWNVQGGVAFDPAVMAAMQMFPAQIPPQPLQVSSY